MVDGRKNTRLLVLLLVCLLLPLPSLGSVQSHDGVASSTGRPEARTQPAPPPLARQSPSSSDPIMYDEQLGMTFTQSFTSMQYHVTAVQQTDVLLGTGPAYLLNGLSDKGYWYQVGLAWNWNPGYTPGTGFNMVYEVFDSTRKSIFPTNGGAGLLSFSGPVNQGDTVSLKLYFTGTGQVVMSATDESTGSYASQTYGAQGATYFVGLPGSYANSNGFFTGLMTEWYHGAPYYGNVQKVVYSNPSLALTSAWMWIDEVKTNGTSPGQVLFSGSTNGPVTFSDAPYQLHEYSLQGATVYADAYEFITGSIAFVALTLSYSTVGGAAPASPVLTYFSNGVQQTAQLLNSPSTYLVDANTQWTVTNPLPGSSGGERWQTAQQTGGVATQDITINFVYYRQFSVIFQFQVVGQPTGYTPPSVSFVQFGSQSNSTAGVGIWADSGSPYRYQRTLTGSTSVERWATQMGDGTVQSPGAVNAVYYHQLLESFSFSTIDGPLVSYGFIGVGQKGVAPPFVNVTSFGVTRKETANMSLWADAGSTYSFQQTLQGANSKERWFATSETKGTLVVPGQTVIEPYVHQYYVIIQSASDAGGSVQPGSGWYNSTQVLTVTQSSRQGWKFEGWRGDGTGAFSGYSDNAVVMVVSPLTETAIFYPGLTIEIKGAGGSVSYQYQNTTGKITGSETIYVQPGTDVAVSAQPDSLFYSFEGWSGGLQSRAQSDTVLVSLPTAVVASFGYNYATVGGVLVSVLALTILAAVVVRRRARN